MAAAEQQHAKLDAILDEEEDEGAGMQVDATGDEAALYAAHLARTRAEDAAADAVARLTVAQVQLAEYAEARAEQAAAAAAEARRALEAAAGGGASASAAAAAAAPAGPLAALCASLEDAAAEAAAFATQQRADAERLKRSAEADGGGGGAGGAAEAAAAAAVVAEGGAAAAAGEAAGAAAADGKSRRSTAGGKRRSGGAGSAGDVSKRRGSAGNGRAAAAAAAGAEGGGGEAKAGGGDDTSSEVHSACSNPTTSTSVSSTSSEEDLDAADDDEEDGARREEGGAAYRRGDLARAQRALAAAADSQDAAVSIRDRARHVPLRLRLEDRRLLRLLEAALGVSEYVDRVDVLTWRSRASRANAQVRDVCAILSGLVVAQDYRAGQRLVVDRDFAANAEFFQDTFEIGRRYKIMNPDKMRDTFGKLVYMLMDAQTPDVQELLGFPLVRPLRSVLSFLEDRVGPDAAALLLDDPLCALATAEIPSGPGRGRADVQRDIRAKERAREALARRHARPPALTTEDVLWCLYSIADNNAFLLFNRDPIDRLLRYFYAAFPEGESPASAELSLAISAGRGGARLTHSHARQWGFVQQSLTLWREIMNDMFRLYALAEADMLARGSGYRLADTGQGLNRVQGAPSVARAMAGIVARVQRRCGGWIGSSVVHMGDHNVPNALFFLDKYMQVPRILNPLVLVLDAIPPLCSRDAGVREYVLRTFGGVEQAQRAILVDFCRHAFDGSGADSWFEAGSCIDGRLTAAWNWADKLEKKAYAPLFRMCGWSGFDGGGFR